MRMEFGLKLDVNQKLVMTPQLCQAIAILQLSTLELAEMVEQEMLENPVLELADAQADSDGEESASGNNAEAMLPEAEPDQQVKEYLEWENYFNQSYEASETTAADEKASCERFAKSAVTLQEHLELQLRFSPLNPAALCVGGYLIGCIDDQGYLSCSLEDAAAALGVQTVAAEKVLKVIQSFDPVGVGARDLKECLNIQLDHRQIQDVLVRVIVDRYLEEVASGHLKQIADQLQVTPREVQQAVDIIRTLNPKPGSAFSSGSESGYIVPDVNIEKVGNSFVIIIDDHSVPRLVINPYYRRVMRDIDSEAKKYVEGRIHAAVWLMKSIEQRRRTLYNVVGAILDCQKDFFELGPKHLAPLTMRRVADQLGIHESTVSRAIANKYASTPHGVFSLRTFFSAGVSGSDGAQLSSARVKREIKEMVAAEASDQPFSDQAIMELLQQQGIAVSRRTVTKYREELGIPASNKRKRY